MTREEVLSIEEQSGRFIVRCSVVRWVVHISGHLCSTWWKNGCLCGHFSGGYYKNPVFYIVPGMLEKTAAGKSPDFVVNIIVVNKTADSFARMF